jgi:ATP-dependent Clp protease ATP-binding subunit ClpC
MQKTMMDISKIYNRFDQNAHTVFRRAMELSGAQRFVGVEHLFVALFDVAQNAIKNAFEGTELDGHLLLKKLRAEVLGLMFHPTWERVMNTPRTRIVLRLAYQIANVSEGSPITPEHLLLAILHEGQSEVMRKMRAMGADEKELMRKFGYAPQIVENVEPSTPSVESVTSNPSRDDPFGEGPVEPREKTDIIPPRKCPEQTVNLAPVEIATPHGEVSTPTLDAYGRDLTRLALEAKIPDVVGREEELERLMVVLSSFGRGNAILVGEPGVGKTVMVHKLAHSILSENVPERLLGCRIVQLDPADISAGTRYVGVPSHK